MRKTPLFVLGASFLSFAVLIPGQTPSPLPGATDRATLKWSDRKVAYSRFDESYAKRIIWEPVINSEKAPAGAEKQRSPQGTRWSATAEPDRMKAGPWNTVIYFGSAANQDVWKLSLNDNTQVEFKWLSEKLVYGSIWWGRIYSTDVILDVESHKFIYREMAQYGDMDPSLPVTTAGCAAS